MNKKILLILFAIISVGCASKQVVKTEAVQQDMGRVYFALTSTDLTNENFKLSKLDIASVLLAGQSIFSQFDFNLYLLNEKKDQLKPLSQFNEHRNRMGYIDIPAGKQTLALSVSWLKFFKNQISQDMALLDLEVESGQTYIIFLGQQGSSGLDLDGYYPALRRVNLSSQLQQYCRKPKEQRESEELSKDPDMAAILEDKYFKIACSTLSYGNILPPISEKFQKLSDEFEANQVVKAQTASKFVNNLEPLEF